MDTRNCEVQAGQVRLRLQGRTVFRERIVVAFSRFVRGPEHLVRTVGVWLERNHAFEGLKREVPITLREQKQDSRSFRASRRKCPQFLRGVRGIPGFNVGLCQRDPNLDVAGHCLDVFA